jgi:hypothetical protein
MTYLTKPDFILPELVEAPVKIFSNSKTRLSLASPVPRKTKGK